MGTSETAHSETQSHQEGRQHVDDDGIRRRINRKLDIGLLPLLSLLYLCNGLDRGNVGNAQTQGFMRDIGLEPDDLNNAVQLFFVTFVLLQPFSVAVGKWIGPKQWIPFIMFAWGVLTLTQAFIKGRAGLISTRMLIGAFEAGFYPTAVGYLSTFYPSRNFATRVGLFYGQYAVAGAFSGAISYGIFHIHHQTLKTWQLLFIIEGALTCGLALLAWAWLPAGPDTAWFLTKEERVLAADRVRAVGTADSAGLTRRDVIETIKDWKLLFVVVCNVCASVPSTAFSVFLPLVVEGMGYSALEANLMTVPPFVCGAVGLYLFALSSDRRGERGYHIVAGILVALVGLIAVVTAPTSRGKYVALCVSLLGSFVSPPLTMAWLSNNTPDVGKRFLVLGVNGWGNLAGVIGSHIYRQEYAPEYRKPFFATLGFVAAAMVGYVAYRAILQAENRRRAAIVREKTADEIEIEVMNQVRYTDQKWTYVYQL
ncbi:major facilitator superfamily domain-containing protein [Apodospora peruviana]|uniref:Major facilitator superfamily domain-containing protein n=1 Tax=Apodospora peruviana TaxID=516989 RepID=A0AAE0HZP1_9PEZI|nr:major facilitator superfamily domain-containing protein [Apodospora peruviana]